MIINKTSPITQVDIFRGIKFDRNLNNILYFDTIEERDEYFSNKIVYSFNDFTPVKNQPGNNQLRIPVKMDFIVDCNYMRYKNANYNDKWFYCFIDSIEFINENMSLINISTDSFTTYIHDVIIEDSFIEREHVDDDTIGKHTFPEGLEIGEYIQGDIQNLGVYQSNENNGYFVSENQDVLLSSAIVIMTTQRYNDNETVGNWVGWENEDNPYGGYNPVYYYIEYPLGHPHRNPLGLYYNTMGAYSTETINSFVESSLETAIICAFMVPAYMIKTVESDGLNRFVGTSKYVCKFEKKYYKRRIENDIEESPTIRNNKLYTYPYCYFALTTSTNTAIYKYEDFIPQSTELERYENIMLFDVTGHISPNTEIRIKPHYYRTQGGTYDTDALTISGWPQCALNIDSYTSFVGQGGLLSQWVNVGTAGLGAISGSISLISGLTTANPAMALMGASAILNSSSQVMSSIQQISNNQFIANHVQGNSNGDSITFTGLKTVKGIPVFIKDEYVTIIDNYFQLYGYKVNRLGKVKLHSRKLWNYIKTIGVNITGTIPNEDLNNIKDIFNKGVTLWHTDDMSMYNRDNIIL